MLINPALRGTLRRQAAAAALIESTVAMAKSGRPLMTRVVPSEDYRVWDHYPSEDAVDQVTGSRWFYHAHPPEERDGDEHGHFHLFLERSIFGTAKPIASSTLKNAAPVVHIAALAIDANGIPRRLFTVNRWVTDEYLFSAEQISAKLNRFDLTNAADGDEQVNRWLTAAVAVFEPEINALLTMRDSAIDFNEADFFEDRAFEILSSTEIDLQLAITNSDRLAGIKLPKAKLSS